MENKQDYLEKSLALLAKYLKETPSEVLNKHIEAVDSMKFEGITVEKYFREFDTHFDMFNNSYALIDKAIFIEVGKNAFEIKGKLQNYSANGKVASNEEESFAGNYQYAMAA